MLCSCMRGHWDRVAQELLCFAVNPEMPWVQQMMLQMSARQRKVCSISKYEASNKHSSPARSIVSPALSMVLAQQQALRQARQKPRWCTWQVADSGVVFKSPQMITKGGVCCAASPKLPAVNELTGMLFTACCTSSSSCSACSMSKSGLDNSVCLAGAATADRCSRAQGSGNLLSSDMWLLRGLTAYRTASMWLCLPGARVWHHSLIQPWLSDVC